MITATRYHDFSAGHRVAGHEGKCRFFHGHNYRVHFTISGGLDNLGRVIDFGVIKSLLCEWLEDNWDHRFLMWKKDPHLPLLPHIFTESLVIVPFNPTAENMAKYLLERIGPDLLPEHVTLIKVRIDETRKCSAEVSV